MPGLFDKGMTLGRPEIVPFRLTPNMLDGMGLAGYEGVFRKVSEVALAVLRGNRDMLISVLETLITDPIVEWQPVRSAAVSGGGGAGSRGAAAAAAAAAAAPDDDLSSTAAGAEKENRDGLKMVKKILERLDGLYNQGVDNVAPQPRSTWKSSRAVPTAAALLRRRAASVPLSIEGQVQRLILEASGDENLALMYLGWLPFV